MECRKCKCPGVVILRKKDPYCTNCFLTNTNHKFRACIGKNKLLSSNEKVLVCLSGGSGSTVLLDLIHSGISMDIHKKLRINPLFLHIIDTKNRHTGAHKLIEQCKSYNFNLYIICISEYSNPNDDVPILNCVPQVEKHRYDQFHTLIENMTTTACNDIMQKIKRNLYIRFAKILNCNFIFTAETMSTLATNLLSNIATGRGSQVENDIGFIDIRDEVVKILRPMRDISQEELSHYIKIKQLMPVCEQEMKQKSIQSVIKAFVSDLQESFPATISTVCKTADKIGVHYETQKTEKCVLCESDLEVEKSTLSALEATNISRTVSDGGSANIVIEESPDFVNVVFPFINKQLCYGCSRNYSEIESSNLPIHIQSLLQKS